MGMFFPDRLVLAHLCSTEGPWGWPSEGDTAALALGSPSLRGSPSVSWEQQEHWIPGELGPHSEIRTRFPATQNCKIHSAYRGLG